MDFLGLIYKLLIGPLELFFEIVYAFAFRFLDDPALAIIFLSLAMNILVLPLYRRADAMQEEERDRAMAMKPWTDHIKKTFSGDERFMVLQTYNRQNGYKQTDVFKGSLSLLLEIPFFIAAFHFLSNLNMLHGASFGPIADLGVPDALLTIGGFSVNVLPLLMTAINIVSAAIYLKGFPLSSKIQTYGIAAIFLLLLYNSPSGLVFYWTLNNIFSLTKNILYKVKIPQFLPNIRSKFAARFAIPAATSADERSFLYSCLFLAVLVGLLIPSITIAASPTEFAEALQGRQPLWFVAETLALALGTFVLWFGVFYRLMTPKGKTIFAVLLFAFIGAALVNFLFFGTNYGNLSPQLQFDTSPSNSAKMLAANATAILLVLGVLIFVGRMRRNIAKTAFLCMLVAAVAVSGFNCFTIQKGLGVASAPQQTGDEALPTFPLSTDGKNVVVFMLDRAIAHFIPFIMNENPELARQYKGFTYYPNTVSFGAYTNVGAPGIYGGYDYTPEEMNKRADAPLVEKHNEALKVMPAIFSEAGFRVSIFDAPYAGYGWLSDESIFDDLVTKGKVEAYTFVKQYGLEEFKDTDLSRYASTNPQSNFSRTLFCYSIFKITPLVLQPLVYHEGDYNSTTTLATFVVGDTRVSADTSQLFTVQKRLNSSKSVGVAGGFLLHYARLQQLSNMTEISNTGENTFLMISNLTTHEPVVLQEPEYRPAITVDNTAFDQAHIVRLDASGRALELPEDDGQDRANSKTMHYEVNMAALRELGEWFDYLREEGVWDNTRIILVSDHGQHLYLDDSLVMPLDGNNSDGISELDLMQFNCLLMVKDFNSTAFVEDDQFMTNADTPLLALEGLVENPVNPYSGNVITGQQKKEAPLRLFYSAIWDTETNNGNTFLPGEWFSVRGDVRLAENWEYLGSH